MKGGGWGERGEGEGRGENSFPNSCIHIGYINNCYLFHYLLDLQIMD